MAVAEGLEEEVVEGLEEEEAVEGLEEEAAEELGEVEVVEEPPFRFRDRRCPFRSSVESQFKS